MRVLVVGGTGLISTAVTQQLLDRGDALTLFNRGQTEPRYCGDVTVLVGDRTDRTRFVRQLREAEPWDCVIDMICSDPEDAAALRRAARGRARQVVFCSTTNVYPKPADAYPVREDHRLGAAYRNGIDKAACERLHREAEAEGEYELTVIRPGHTYGETGGVLHSLGQTTSYLDRLRRGRPIIVHGDGQGLWSALHADDVASIFAAAAGSDRACGRTYNACGEEWMTWDQYHEKVAEAMGAPEPQIVHIPIDVLERLAPQRADHPRRSLQYPGIYDMTAARRDLGFRQRIRFVDGIRRVIRWLRRDDAIEPWDSDKEYEMILNRWEACLESLEACSGEED
jgi:nucleoside-diphosphate-sugar epimerase